MKSNLHTQQTLTDLLRRCVGCGLCLPHCATWAVTGNEVHSPRGRLVLLDDLLKDPAPETRAAYSEAFQVCIGCRACETACPSGVPFELLEHGQRLTSAGARDPRGVLPYLIHHLDSLNLLNGMRIAGKVSRGLFRGILGAQWRRKLSSKPLGLDKVSRLLGSLPAAPDHDDELIGLMSLLTGPKVAQPLTGFALPQGEQDVVFFAGCANKGLLPGTSRRLVEVLNAGGCRVKIADQHQCCGALASHSGQPGKAALLKRANLQTLSAKRPSHFDNPEPPIVVEAAGCGLHLKDYGDPISNRIVDAVILLDQLSLPSMQSIPLKVVYHDPCHARHGQGIFAEPRRLLNQIPGLVLVEAQEAEMCCGSGGAWGLNHRQMSEDLSRRKARNLANTQADLVVTSNPGCLGQVADGLALEAPGLPVIPLTDLLWFALQGFIGAKNKGLSEDNPIQL